MKKELEIMIELKKNEEELTQEVMGKISLSKDKVNVTRASLENLAKNMDVF